jgi:large subunit ribosomal protein L35
MRGKAKPGKQRSNSSAKKRFKKTGKGQFAQQKAAHNHLLQQKSKRQKRLAGKTIIASKSHKKVLNQLLPN